MILRCATALLLALALVALAPAPLGASPRRAVRTSTPTRVRPASSRPTATPVARRYAFPVRAAAKVSYVRYHHDYPATDIFCPTGSEFVAPTDGVVDYVSRVDEWKPATDDPASRGGVSIALVGDDGVRYYGSHLSAIGKGIAPGMRVRVGELLGYTGKSGNARATAPHLHFGISRPTTPDDWQVRRGEFWPYEYLRAWQRGEMLKPKLP